MNFIPLTREEQRRIAARRKGKEEGSVKETHSSMAGEGSLIVDQGRPQSIEHIIEREEVAEQTHVEAAPEHVATIQQAEASLQEHDSHVKTSLLPENSPPHHQQAENPPSVPQQPPLDQQISHLTLISHQDPPPPIPDHPVLIKQVITSIEVEHHDSPAEPAEPKPSSPNENSQQNMKIEMIESQYEHPLGRDHQDIKVVESHEEQLTLSQKIPYRRMLNSNQGEPLPTLPLVESLPIHYESQEDHLIDSKVQNYRRNLSNAVVMEEPNEPTVPPEQPHIHEEIPTPIEPQPIIVLPPIEQHQNYPQQSRSTFTRNLDQNQPSPHPAPQPQPLAQHPINHHLEIVSIPQHQQSSAHMQKSKLKRSLQTNLHKPPPQQIKIQQLIENVNPHQLQKSKRSQRSLAPHLEQSEVSKLISIGHFEENMLMVHSTKLRRDLQSDRIQTAVMEKVDVSRDEQAVVMGESVKLKRELKMNNQLLGVEEKVEVVSSEESFAMDRSSKLRRELKVDREPVVLEATAQRIDVGQSEENFAQGHSTKLKRQLKLTNELPAEPVPIVQVKPPPMVLSVQSSNEDYLEHSISKSKRLLSPDNKPVFPEEQQVVVEPPIEHIAEEKIQHAVEAKIEPVVEEKIVAEPVQLQLDQPQEHMVPEMSESIKLKRNLQPPPPKVSERLPIQQPLQENLKTIDQGMTDSIKLKRNLQAPPPVPPQHIPVHNQTQETYNNEKTVKLLKRDLPTNTLPQPQPEPEPQQQILAIKPEPIPQPHIDPPAQHALIELPRAQVPHFIQEDNKSEKSARSDITQGWDDKKQIFKMFKLPPTLPNLPSNLHQVHLKPINSLHFK